MDKLPSARKVRELKKANAADRRRLLLTIALWSLAFVLTLGSAVWQRVSGPTHPKSVRYGAAGRSYHAKLIRSGTTGEDAAVVLPAVDGMAGFLRFKRHGVEEEYATLPMYNSDGKLTGYLPSQPMAGKLEYYVELKPEFGGTAEVVRVPFDRSVVIRFKGPVPNGALVPHIVIIFLSMLFGMRALLEALYNGPALRPLAWGTIVTLLIGGMYYGPVVQKYSFGEYWTGVPFGWDLTDNKTLIALIFWLVAAWVLGFRGPLRRRARWLTLLAAVVMAVVFLIPHSILGSELDYAKLEQGVPAEEAIGVG